MTIRSIPELGNIGREVDHVEVVVGPRFLDLFSKHLYRSPNKAFEELVSNSWDAGAGTVYISIPSNLNSPNASVWILDNGESMNADGLKQLWRIAESQKPQRRGGRPQIGKFGIGKLATYLLAGRLTYICKAADEKVRLIEMDYALIEKAQSMSGSGGANLMARNPISRPLRELTPADLDKALDQIDGGNEIRRLIDEGVPRVTSDDPYLDEFGQPDSTIPNERNTWTLAIMTDLKELGRSMQVGWIRYVLRTALPLGSSMSIVLNQEALTSTKVDKTIADKIVLGPELIKRIADFTYQSDLADAKSIEKRIIHVGTEPVPHIKLDGVEGIITGTAMRYEGSISGKKSDELARSNGFFVNVLGRVVNADDPYFALENLSHTVWSEFRMCVRADGLDPAIGINREQLNDGPDLHIFRSFLRAVFNLARRDADDPLKRPWQTAGELLAKSWGAIPLRSFQRALRKYEREGAFPDNVILPDTSGADGDALSDVLDSWEASARDDPGSIVSSVEFNPLGSLRPLCSYDVNERKIIVNLDHPFVRQHGKSISEQRLLEDLAVTETLASARLTDIGVSEPLIADYQDYRDQLYRIVANIRRDSGVVIAEQLLNVTDDDDALEIIVGDALEYIGFDVRRMAGNGEPEGVATSPVAMSTIDPRNPYRFTYDAKSTARKAVKTKDVNVAALEQHRRDCKANYVLVIGPAFQEGQLQELCRQAHVTPMRARDLARLLMLAAGTGPLDLKEFETIFDHHDPSEVKQWVDERVSDALERPRLSLVDVISAVEKGDYIGGEPISAGAIANDLRRAKVVPQRFTRNDVLKIFNGLEVLVPSLINVVKEDIYLGTSPNRLREAIVQQVNVIPEEFRFGLTGLQRVMAEA